MLCFPIIHPSLTAILRDAISLYILRVFFRTAYLLYYCEHSGVDLMGLTPNP